MHHLNYFIEALIDGATLWIVIVILREITNLKRNKK